MRGAGLEGEQSVYVRICISLDSEDSYLYVCAWMRWVWVPRVALGVAGGSEGPKKSEACTSGSSPHSASNDDHRLLSSCHTPTYNHEGLD